MLFSSVFAPILVAAAFLAGPADNEQCLDLRDPVDPGAVSQADWDSWTGLEVDYALALEHLAVVPEGTSLSLRQQLVASDRGSDRVVMKVPVEPSSTYRLTQRVLFEPGFDWGRELQGGKLGFGLAGGSAPTGGDLDTDGFSARYHWRGNRDGTARLVVYSYAADRSQNPPYGDDYPLRGFEIPVGEWFELAMEITANSSHNTEDGSIKAWANDELLLHLEGIRWQTGGTLPTVDKLIYSTFHGGASLRWAPSRTNHVRFSDVCWGEPAPPAATTTPEREQLVAIRSVAATMLPTGKKQVDFRVGAARNRLDIAVDPERWLPDSRIATAYPVLLQITVATYRMRAAAASYQASAVERRLALDLSDQLAHVAERLAIRRVAAATAVLRKADCVCVNARYRLALAEGDLVLVQGSPDAAIRANFSRRAWDRAQRSMSAN